MLAWQTAHPILLWTDFANADSVHVQGECFSVRQFLLEPLGGMAAETLLVQLGKSAVGGAGGQARNSEHAATTNASLAAMIRSARNFVPVILNLLRQIAISGLY